MRFLCIHIQLWHVTLQFTGAASFCGDLVELPCYAAREIIYRRIQLVPPDFFCHNDLDPCLAQFDHELTALAR